MAGERDSIILGEGREKRVTAECRKWKRVEYSKRDPRCFLALALSTSFHTHTYTSHFPYTHCIVISSLLSDTRSYDVQNTDNHPRQAHSKCSCCW